MADQRLAQAVDKEIRLAEKGLAELPPEVKTRTVLLKLGPLEVVKKIRQVDGIFIEIEERI